MKRFTIGKGGIPLESEKGSWVKFEDATIQRVSARQIFIAFSKYEDGLRPGDESWSPEDQQVLDLIELDKLGELSNELPL